MLPVTDNNIYHYWPSTPSCNGSTVWVGSYCIELIGQLQSFKVVVLLCLAGPGKQKYRLHSSMYRNLQLFRFKDNKYTVQLVFPVTSEWIKLEVHIEMYGHILAIEIDGPVSIHHSENFFCVLYTAVHYLTKNPITNQEPCISPTCSISLSNCLQSQVEPCCTFLKGDHVYKLYDTEVDSTNICPLSPIWRRKKIPPSPLRRKENSVVAQ